MTARFGNPEHGTAARYVLGCRCDLCTAAKRDAWRKRQQKVNEAEGDVRPTGPPIPGFLVRNGKQCNTTYCPGANGKECVVPGRAWLRGRLVCKACVERETVWNGLVPADAARAHLLWLRSRGIGYKNAAAASSVNPSIIAGIIQGRRTQLRAQTEKRILALDEGARSEGSRVPAAQTRKTIQSLLERGFTKTELAKLLGASAKSPALQMGKGPTVTFETAVRVEKLAKKVRAGTIIPRAWGTAEDAKELVRRGVHVPSLENNEEAISWFKRELAELRALRESGPFFTPKSNLEIINLSEFKDT